METRCTIKGAALKAEVTKEEGGGAHVETFWLVTFKIPADSIDANELNNMVALPLTLNAVADQFDLGLAKTTEDADGRVRLDNNKKAKAA